jgi:hypothetical protein
MIAFRRAGGIDHGAGVALLVAQLHQRGAALRQELRELGQAAAARVLGIDNGIEAEIDGHCLIQIRVSFGKLLLSLAKV